MKQLVFRDFVFLLIMRLFLSYYYKQTFEALLTVLFVFLRHGELHVVYQTLLLKGKEIVNIQLMLIQLWEQILKKYQDARM
jgi:hypothetical protein